MTNRKIPKRKFWMDGVQIAPSAAAAAGELPNFISEVLAKRGGAADPTI
jgi:hypothetical protein